MGTKYLKLIKINDYFALEYFVGDVLKNREIVKLNQSKGEILPTCTSSFAIAIDRYGIKLHLTTINGG